MSSLELFLKVEVSFPCSCYDELDASLGHHLSQAGLVGPVGMLDQATIEPFRVSVAEVMLRALARRVRLLEVE